MRRWQHPRRAAEDPARHRGVAEGQWRRHLRFAPLAHPRRRPRHASRVPARLEGRLDRRPVQRYQGWSRAARPDHRSQLPLHHGRRQPLCLRLPLSGGRQRGHQVALDLIRQGRARHPARPHAAAGELQQTADALIVTLPAAAPIAEHALHASHRRLPGPGPGIVPHHPGPPSGARHPPSVTEPVRPMGDNYPSLNRR